MKAKPKKDPKKQDVKITITEEELRSNTGIQIKQTKK